MQNREGQQGLRMGAQLFWYLAVGMLAGAPAWAADNSNETAAFLGEVTVTGEKMPRSFMDTPTAVTVLSGDEVDQGQHDSVNKLAERVPNALANPVGGITLRGVEGSGPAQGVNSFISGGRPRVSTMVDGVSELWSGQQYLDVGLWDVDQVEILRGPQSTTQGRNAIGGAVVVNTKDPTFQPEGAIRAGWANEQGRANLAAMLSGPILDNELAFRLAADGTKGHGFIDYPGQWPWDPSEIQTINVRGKLLWQPQGIPDLKAKLTLSHRDYQGQYLNIINSKNLDDYTFYQGRGSNTRRQDSKNTTITGETEYALNEAFSAHLQYSFADNKLGFEQAPSFMSLQLDEKSHTLESRLVYDTKAFNGVLGLYFYERSQNLDARENVFAGTDKLTALAAYGDGTLHLNERWDLLLGARLEREHQQRDVLGWGSVPIKADISANIFLPKAGLAWHYAPQNTLAFTVRKGYNPGAGTLDENDHFYEYGSESVWTWELSNKSRVNERLLLTTNLFYNDYTDLQMSHAGRLQNMPAAQSYGLEMTADAQVTSSLQLYGTLGLLHSEVKEGPAWGKAIVGNEFSYAPKMTASLGARQRIGQLTLGADISHVGEYYTDMQNDPALKGGNYTLANVLASYDMGKWVLRGYVNNLFNKEAVLKRFTGRRSMDYYVGAPRTIGVNAEYRF